MMLTGLVAVGQRNSLLMVAAEVVQRSYREVVEGLRRRLVEVGATAAAERQPVGSIDNMQHSSDSHHKPRKGHHLAD